MAEVATVGAAVVAGEVAARAAVAEAVDTRPHAVRTVAAAEAADARYHAVRTVAAVVAGHSPAAIVEAVEIVRGAIERGGRMVAAPDSTEMAVVTVVVTAPDLTEAAGVTGPRG